MKHNPAVVLESEPQWLHPLQAGPGMLLAVAREPATLEAVRATLERLLPDPYIEHLRRYYAAGLERFGPHWSYADRLTVLHAAARLLRPRTYLEIGDFRGCSLAIVAAAAPECALYAFDRWAPGQADRANAGPELVREQLRRVGQRADARLESGDAHTTVPRFLAEHADLGLDLVTVAGEATEGSARCDLETLLPRVNVGGALVLDDIRHPSRPGLERVWDETVAALPTFASAKFVEVGHGVAVAVRRLEDDAILGSLRGDGGSRLAQLANALDELRAERVERIEVLENEMARRLELIQRQGAELGRIPALEAEVERLGAKLESAEADRDTLAAESGERLAVIERLAAESAERAGVIGRLTAESAERLEVIERLAAESAERLDMIERLAAESAERLDRIERLAGGLRELEELARRACPRAWLGLSPPWEVRRARRASERLRLLLRRLASSA